MALMNWSKSCSSGAFVAVIGIREYLRTKSLRVFHSVGENTLVVLLCGENNLKGATSRFVHFEKFSLNFSSWSFAIRVNLLHP